MKYIALAFGFSIILSVPFARGVFIEKPDANTLWMENGKNIAVGSPTSSARWRGGGPSLASAPDGGFILKASGEARASTGRYVPLNVDYPYLVMDVVKVKNGPGYRSFVLLISDGSRRAFGRIETTSYVQSGRYVVRMLRPEMNPPKIGFLAIYLYNTAITVKDLKMVKRPKNNLEILCPPGAKEVKPGDGVTFRVALEKPAEDVTLTFFDGYTMPHVELNGRTRLQLKPEDDAQTIWSAEIKVKTLTHQDDQAGLNFKPGGLMVKTTILGGAFKEPLWTWNLIPFNFKGGK